MKWDGEWAHHLRGVSQIWASLRRSPRLIYVLVVGWFQSFLTPLIIMAAISVSLVGIPARSRLMGGSFTATSMIGFIARRRNRRAQQHHPGRLIRTQAPGRNAAG